LNRRTIAGKRIRFRVGVGEGVGTGRDSIGTLRNECAACTTIADFSKEGWLSVTTLGAKRLFLGLWSLLA
jgi:hypothetical protein